MHARIARSPDYRLRRRFRTYRGRRLGGRPPHRRARRHGRLRCRQRHRRRQQGPHRRRHARREGPGGAALAAHRRPEHAPQPHPRGPDGHRRRRRSTRSPRRPRGSPTPPARTSAARSRRATAATSASRRPSPRRCPAPGSSPSTMSSIVAPQPGSGTLSAMVKDADERPVVNMPVQAVGPTPQTKKTNDAGCAVFSALDAGSYDVKVDHAGWVDTEGSAAGRARRPRSTPGILTTVEFVYDLARADQPGQHRHPRQRTAGDADGRRATASARAQRPADRLPHLPGVADRRRPRAGQALPVPGRRTRSTPARAPAPTPSCYVPSYFEDNPSAAPKINRGANFGRIDVLEPATRLVVRSRHREQQHHAQRRAGLRLPDARVVRRPADRHGHDAVDARGLRRHPAAARACRSATTGFCTQWTDTSSPQRGSSSRRPSSRTGTATGATATTTLLIPNSPTGGNGSCPATA